MSDKETKKIEKQKKKEEKQIARAKAKGEGKTLWQQFKKFITRGNVIDMAVGVIIGGAFGAIVTALVNILLSVCTWGVPGGISGLVTVLPALNPSQAAPEGFKDVLTATEYLALPSNNQAIYVQHGANYYFKGLAIIDWGALINAAISFLIIALTLFVIVKVVGYLNDKRAKIVAAAQEEYYKKHPEARPILPEPAPYEPTDHEILKQMLVIMKQNSEKKTK